MFGARDLALFLPDKAGDLVSLRHTKIDEEEAFEPLKPKIDQSKKVTRYYSGKAPTWIDEKSNEKSSSCFSSSSVIPVRGVATITSSCSKIEPTKIVDRRLQRLAAQSSISSSSSAVQDKQQPPEKGRRRIYEAEVIVDTDDVIEKEDIVVQESKSKGRQRVLEEGMIINDMGDDEIEEQEEENNEVVQHDDVDDIQARRTRVMNRMASRQQHEIIEPVIIIPSSSSSSSSSSSINTIKKSSTAIKYEKERESEYETDTDDDSSDDGNHRIKPVFVTRNNRETLKEQEKKAEYQLIVEKQKDIQLHERKQQTREMVAESIRRNKEARLMENTDTEDGKPDDTDDPDDDDEIEFENWKLREISRLKRDSELRETSVLEKADLERRRQMTEAERYEEDKALGKFDEKEKSKWKFLQKYYHKGVFYMDDESIEKDKEQNHGKEDVRKRTFDEPTLEDKFNRESLPAVLQVKKFGMRGRTKYTHLVDQDTTQFVNPLVKKDSIKETYLKLCAGTGNIDSAGRLQKKSTQNYKVKFTISVFHVCNYLLGTRKQ